MGDISQVSIRLDNDKAKEFRQYCQELGVNQSQGFEHLLKVLELNNAKAAVPSREKEMEEFESHAKAMIDIYLNSIKLNENAEFRAKDQFSSDLKAKDKAIEEYQNKIDELKEKLKEAQKDIKEKENSLKMSDTLMGKIEKERKNAQEIADGAKELNKTLEDRVNELSSNIKKYDELQKTNSSLLKELHETKEEKEKLKADYSNASERLKQQNEVFERTLSERDELRKTVGDLNIELSGLKKDMEKAVSDAKKDAEIEKEKALFSVREEYNEKIMKIREEKAALESQVKLLTNTHG